MKFIFSALLLLSSLCSFAQSNSLPKFGSVKPDDFLIQSTLIDSSTDVVVLFDIGSSEFVGNTDGDFSLIFKRRQRMLIKKRTGFDYATIKIPLYSGGNTTLTEMLTDFKAITYTINNGKINEIKFGKNDLLSEKESKVVTNKKFAFPALTEGCIVEFEYAIRSPFYSKLKSWAFQSEKPILLSQYTVSIPRIFDYLTTRRGYLPFNINQGSTKYKSYTIKIPSNDPGEAAEFINLAGDDIVHTWGIENSPAFKAENYVYTALNHLTRLQFHLRSINYSATNIKLVVKDWASTANELLQDESFGKPLSDFNEWMQEDLNRLGSADPLQKAKNIYSFIHDNFSCNDYDDKWLTQTLKKTFQAKVGSVGDINLLLCAMLKKAGFEAAPVLLSTTDNGKIEETMALVDQYNYVVVRLKIGIEFYYLDASRPFLGFAKLSEDCYNGSGRVIQTYPESVDFFANSISDESFTSVLLLNESGNTMTGKYYNKLGDYSSISFRSKFFKNSNAEIQKEVTKDYSNSYNISNFVVDSLNAFERPVSISFDFKLKDDDENADIIYFNPMLKEGYDKNPFSIIDRKHPVEMPYKLNETYTLTMDIPKGYSVEELPKSERVTFNGNEGIFEYIISKNDGKLFLKSKLNFKKAIFFPGEYEVLRDFFAKVVKKHAEQIVFKKNS